MQNDWDWSEPYYAFDETPNDPLVSTWEDDAELETTPQPENITLSKVWRDTPMDIQAIIIDMLCEEAKMNWDWEEDENDPVLWNNGMFSDKARTKTWNNLLAVGGYFSREVLHRLIRYEWWSFDDFDKFCLALQSWQIVSPGSWDQIRVLRLDKVLSDGSNAEDMIAILSKVHKLTNLQSLRIIFEIEINALGYVSRYFDKEMDLDESHPELFQALRTVQAPEVSIHGLTSPNMLQYLTSVMTKDKSPFIPESGILPPWRREPQPPRSVDDWGFEDEFDEDELNE